MDYSYSVVQLSRSRRHDASISIHYSSELQLSMLAYESVVDPFEMLTTERLRRLNLLCTLITGRIDSYSPE